MKNRPESVHEFLRCYPRICAHIIAESLGYATPSKAALILKDAKEGTENWCEWIYSCYRCDPRLAVSAAIKNRHLHQGYMAEYKIAKALVDLANRTGEEPVFASWF